MQYSIHVLEQHRDSLLQEAIELKELQTSKYRPKCRKYILREAGKRKIEQADELNEAIKILNECSSVAEVKEKTCQHHFVRGICDKCSYSPMDK